MPEKMQDSGNERLAKDFAPIFNDVMTGQFGDFSTDKYATPKVELVRQLEVIIENVKQGKYDA